jgi:DNA polymerase I
VILSCDYGQIELRVLAQVVRKDLKRLVGEDSETVLDEMFASGQDVHWLTAKSMYALPAQTGPEDHGRLRVNAKAANFSLAFGMGLATFTKRLRADREISITEAELIRQAWFAAFPDVALWQKLFAAERHRFGYVETWLGRPWYWRWRALEPDAVPDDVPFREDLIEGFSKPLCLNLRVQGSAAELMQLAIVYAHRALNGTRARLIATVHDELVVECPENDLDETRALTVEAMTRAFQKLFPLAPLVGLVDAAAGPSWGEVS